VILSSAEKKEDGELQMAKLWEVIKIRSTPLNISTDLSLN
jgi:hypothetical protein